jgi:hypothetical protein
MLGTERSRSARLPGIGSGIGVRESPGSSESAAPPGSS